MRHDPDDQKTVRMRRRWRQVELVWWMWVVVERLEQSGERRLALWIFVYVSGRVAVRKSGRGS